MSLSTNAATFALFFGATGMNASDANASERFQAELIDPSSPRIAELCKDMNNRSGKIMANGQDLCYSLDGGKNWIPYYAAGASLAALIAAGALFAFMVIRRRGYTEGRYVYNTPKINGKQDEPFFDPVVEGGESTLARDGDTQGHTQNDLFQDEAIDPVSVANVLINYKRYDDAIKGLENALEKSPNNISIGLKLLELFHYTKNTVSFESLYLRLTDEKFIILEEEKATMQEMGREIDPENPLYQAAQREKTDMEEGAIITDTKRDFEETQPNLINGGTDETASVEIGANEKRWKLNDHLKSGADKRDFILGAIPGDGVRMTDKGRIIKVSDGSWEHINGSVRKHYTEDSLLADEMSQGSGKGRKTFIVDSFGVANVPVRRTVIDSEYLAREYEESRASSMPIFLTYGSPNVRTRSWEIVQKKGDIYTLQDSEDVTKKIELPVNELVEGANEFLTSGKEYSVEEIVTEESASSETETSEYIPEVTEADLEKLFDESGKPHIEVLVPAVLDSYRGGWTKGIGYTEIKERMTEGEHIGEYRYISENGETKYMSGANIVSCVNIYSREFNEGKRPKKPGATVAESIEAIVSGDIAGTVLGSVTKNVDEVLAGNDEKKKNGLKFKEGNIESPLKNQLSRRGIEISTDQEKDLIIFTATREGSNLSHETSSTSSIVYSGNRPLELDVYDVVTITLTFIDKAPSMIVESRSKGKMVYTINGSLI